MFPWLGLVPWRLVGAAAAVAAIAVMGWRVSVWRNTHVRLYPEAVAALEAEQACADGTKCSERLRTYTEAVGHEQERIVMGYEAELESARNRPARVVRLCADSGGVRRPGTTSGDHGTGTGTVELPRSAGVDIGPALYDLARDADTVAARLRACQSWAKAVSTLPQ